MEIKDYWWEEQLDKMLYEFVQDDYYASSSDIKLFILKVINKEKQNGLEELSNKEK